MTDTEDYYLERIVRSCSQLRRRNLLYDRSCDNGVHLFVREILMNLNLGSLVPSFSLERMPV